MADFNTITVPLTGSRQNLKTATGINPACQILILAPDNNANAIITYGGAQTATATPPLCLHLDSGSSGQDDRLVLNPANGIMFSQIDVLGASGHNLNIGWMTA